MYVHALFLDLPVNEGNLLSVREEREKRCKNHVHYGISSGLQFTGAKLMLSLTVKTTERGKSSQTMNKRGRILVMSQLNWRK